MLVACLILAPSHTKAERVPFYCDWKSDESNLEQPIDFWLDLEKKETSFKPEVRSFEIHETYIWVCVGPVEKTETGFFNFCMKLGRYDLKMSTMIPFGSATCHIGFREKKF